MSKIQPLADLRQMPHNDKAEQEILGALLNKPESYKDVHPNLRADDFFRPVHGKLFAVLSTAIMSGKPYGVRRAAELFRDLPELEQAGGADFVGALAASNVSALMNDGYSEHILDLARRRRMIEAMRQLSERAYGGQGTEETADALIAEAGNRLAALVEGDIRITQRALSDFVADAMVASESARKGIKPRAVPTGIEDLDAEALLEPGGLYILAARPKMGKSALAGNVAISAARAGAPVLFISQEMTGIDLAQRVIATETGISVQRQKRGADLGPHDWMQMSEAEANIKPLPVTINDAGSMSLAKMQIAARRWHRMLGERDGWRPGIIVIDHLGRMDKAHQRQSDYEGVSENVKGIKSLAKDLNVPILLLAQLSRNVEKRDDKRPLLSDLRDSGRIEEEADGIWMLYREAYYLKANEPARRLGETDDKFNERYAAHAARLAEVENHAELIVAKNRQGIETTIDLHWDGGRQLFRPRSAPYGY